MIILEGADNTGKSTLANHLATLFDLPIVHAGGPGYHPQRLRNEFNLLTKKCIMDRTNFISGPVYAKAFGKAKDKSYLNYTAQQGFVNYLVTNNLALVIHCVGYGEATKREEESAEYAQSVIDNDETIRLYYSDFFDNVKWLQNYFRYNFNMGRAELDKVASVVKSFLQLQEHYFEDFREMAKKIPAHS